MYSYSEQSALSHIPLATVIDELTWSIQHEVWWCILFSDDIVLVDETRYLINAMLES